MKNYMHKLLVLFCLMQSLSDLQAQKPFIPNFWEKQTVASVMTKVADWQIDHFAYQSLGSAGLLHDYGIDAWTNATLYIGMSRFAMSLVNEGKLMYKDWLCSIGERNDWCMPANFKDNPKYSLYHADELCVGQFYLMMYDVCRDDRMLLDAKNRLDWIIQNPPDFSMSHRNKQSLTWSDALFMAPPLYAQMSTLTNRDIYWNFMDKEFKRTYAYLYDSSDSLFFRDDSYFDKQEANGAKVFWGRGNGWVVAGLVNLLKVLPEDVEGRSFYVTLLLDMVLRLVSLQDDEGFWHASLLDAASYPSPETSATALISYGLAYCINEGLVEEKVYLPYLKKSWKALCSSVDEDGKLGWVQPIGADPKKVTEEMTAVYGVGAFLMVGTEVYELISNYNM